MRFPAPSSLRWSIVFGFTVTIAVILAGVFIITRSILMDSVTQHANDDVVQELSEFNSFAAEGVDPRTGEPFADAETLITTYMARQIPGEDELFLGLLNAKHQLVQPDMEGFARRLPDVIDIGDPLIEHIRNSNTNGGFVESTEYGPVHWGRVAINTGGEEDDYFIVAVFTHDARAEAAAQIRQVGLVALVGMALAILLAWLIAGQIIAPVRRLEKVSTRISNEDLTARVPVKGTNEIARLSRTFNAMLDRIEEAYAHQRQFIDDAGHELRTPITVVRGQLELLHTADPEQQQRSIALATAELDRMARMVEDMLTLAVADSGEFVHTRPTEIADLVIDIADKAETLDDRVMLTELAEGTYDLDAQRITQALLELIRNALRYSEDQVELGATVTQDAGLELWVRDRGPGINTEELDQLFGRFSRSEHATDTGAGPQTRPGGAGLGLSIVAAIAKAHGGAAFARNNDTRTNEGAGATFGLTLPPSAQETPDASEPDR